MKSTALSSLSRILAVFFFAMCGTLASNVPLRGMPWWPAVTAGLAGLVFSIVHLVLEDEI